MLKISLASLSVLLLGNIPVPGPVMKCGSSDVTPRIAIDGQIRAHLATLDELDVEVSRQDISHVEIICMDEADSTFNTTAGLPVVSVWTKQSPVGQIPDLLQSVVEAQIAHQQAHSDFASELDDLDLPAVPGVELLMWRHEDGWIAEAGVERFLTRCFIYDGIEQRFHLEMAIREPRCISLKSLGIPSWRPLADTDAN